MLKLTIKTKIFLKIKVKITLELELSIGLKKAKYQKIYMIFFCLFVKRKTGSKILLKKLIKKIFINFIYKFSGIFFRV